MDFPVFKAIQPDVSRSTDAVLKILALTKLYCFSVSFSKGVLHHESKNYNILAQTYQNWQIINNFCRRGSLFKCLLIVTEKFDVG